ncbi:hypothetical protein ACHQM5_004201 [Ranunculus cassubicifolius]
MEPVVSAVTQVLLQEVYRSLKDEKNTFVFKVEFDQIEEKLKWMKSFLSDAQELEKKHRNYVTLKTCISELRDLVYDADDIILDYQIRDAFEAVFPSRRNTPRGHHFRWTAERALKEISKRIDDMEKKFKTYMAQMNMMIHGVDKATGPSGRQVSRISSLTVPVGLEDDTQKLLDWITTNEKSCQIAIVGMGGSGKTTIARKIFYCRDVFDHFDRRIWVKVSQAFTEEDVLATMLKQIRVNEDINAPPYTKVDDNLPADDDMSLICQSLTNKKYLIVIDDVWTMDYNWWKKLTGRLRNGEGCKSSIIITTRHEHLAREMGATAIHKVQKLDEDKSWFLFCAITFHGKESMVSNTQFEQLGKDIVKKCVGHPLAIKTIAEHLSTKLNSLHPWREVCVNFSGELENRKTVLASLRLSYDDLPAALKHCIMCFSVYPEGTEINAEQLVYWWVSEGFVQGNGHNTAIEVAFMWLRELVSRCLVESVEQRGYDGRVYKCTMHNMVRDLIVKISRDEKFCSFDQGSKSVPDGDTRHLGYTREMNLESLKSNQKLRTFLLMENCSFSFRPALAAMNSLRVLDLSRKLDHVRVNDLLRWVKSQKRLAYLNLEGFDHLRELPDWIKKRQNLKILVLKDCIRLKKLPPSIIHLQNLVLLDVENCPLGYLPREFGKLTNLQVLYGFKLAKQGRKSTTLSELKHLTKLRVLKINLSEKDEIADGEGYILRALPRLKVLYIDTKKCDRNIAAVVKKLVPPPALEELHLCSYHGDITPHWLDPSTLPELLYLSVSSGQIATVSSRFWKTDEKPWKIEGLFLKNLPRFKLDWEVLGTKMEYLRHVEVTHCQCLKLFPIDVKNHGVWERDRR